MLTKKGFSLSDWVDYWLDEFSALTRTPMGSASMLEPLEHKWLRLLDWLEKQSQLHDAQLDGVRKKNQAKDMLDELLGPQLLKYASPDFWETSSMKAAEIPYSMWYQMSLCERGRMIAHNRVSNAIDGLTRYAMKLKSNKARNRQQAKTRKKSGRKPRGRRR